MATENEQNVDAVNQVDDTQEQDQNDATPDVLTQDQVDAIISSRLQEKEEQHAEQLRQMREQAEATIRGYDEALRTVQARGQGTAEDDDPMPAGLTPNQKLMWDANAPMRAWTRKQQEKSERQTAQAINPILHDTTVRQFFAGRAKIPENIKARAQALFTQAVNNPNVKGDPQQIIQAAYYQALAMDAEERLLGTSALQNVGTGAGTVNGGQKKQPVVKAPNGQMDTGSGTRPMGVGRIGKKDETWQEIQQSLIASGKFPEDPL